MNTATCNLRRSSQKQRPDLVLGLALFTLTCAAQAQTYPSRYIRLIVASPPGGPGSIIARPVAQKLGDAFGQSVIVDFISGAAGIIGTDLVAKSQPVGYTLLQISTRFTLGPSMYAKLPFDTLKDFAPISPVSTGHLVLVIHPGVPAKTPQELIALAKRQPGKLTYGSSGAGSSLHLAGELIDSMAGTKMLHVPYRGAGPALIDLIGGQIDMMFVALPPALNHIRNTQVRALGVASLARAAALPDLPTLHESGLPGFQVDSRNGIVAAAGTPAAIVNKLNTTLVQILRTPEMKERFASFGVEPLTSTPAEFARYLQNEIALWSKVAKAAGIEPQ